MNKEVLVEVKGLSKKYCKDLKKSLMYGVMDIVRQIFGIKLDDELRDKEFWVLNNLSFNLKRGECLGLIGHNGAGKSSLLKVLNGLVKPDRGSVLMKGNVSALIELGAGFNPVLTGRENIFNNGSVLGLSKEEINNKLEDIILFSELNDFIDSPVQYYSSGMKVRLGFAIAAQLKPDILLIDEVLAVGDLGFVLKCFKRIDEILPDTAVIFVSHNMALVSRICSKILLLDSGKVEYIGESVSTGIDKYYSHFSKLDSNVIFTEGSVSFIDSTLSVNDGVDFSRSTVLNWMDTLNFKIKFENLQLKNTPYVYISIFDKEHKAVALLDTKYIRTSLNKGVFEVIGSVKNIQLSKGLYNINIALFQNDQKDPIIRVNGISSFQVIHKKQTWPPFLLSSTVNISQV